MRSSRRMRGANGAAAVDLLDPEAVAASLRGADAIVHCAAIPSPGERVTGRTSSRTTPCRRSTPWKRPGRRGSGWPSWPPADRSTAPPGRPSCSLSPTSRSTRTAPSSTSTRTRSPRTSSSAWGRCTPAAAMTVTALRFHWIATTEELRRRAEQEPDAGGRPHAVGVRATWRTPPAPAYWRCGRRPTAHPSRRWSSPRRDTWARESTEQLLDQYSPQSERRAGFPAATGLFDCSRAARVHRLDAAESTGAPAAEASAQGCESDGGPPSSSKARSSG